MRDGVVSRESRGLNPEQRAFVDAPCSASFVLRAGAGSGKTHTLVARIQRLMHSGGTVLVFSHANKTVDEIRSRLELQGCHATVMTMHKYCISRMHASKISVPTSPDALMEEAALAFEAGLVRCFEEHVIVDEANDLSSEQNRIVLELHRRGHMITLTGDMEQSIYGFQGSSPHYLKAFERMLPTECVFELRTNYRSSNSLIVDLANAIASDDIRDGLAVYMAPRDDASPSQPPRILAYHQDEGLLDAVILEVRRLQGKRSDSIMILAHDNVLLGRAHSHLMAHGVAAVLHCSKRSEEFRRIPRHLQRSGVVQLLTVHGAKGGEADHVLLLSGEDRGDALEGEADGESRRVLYVACTRARRSLVIFYKMSRQPIRWLSAAWHLLQPGAGVVKFSSRLQESSRPPSLDNSISVTQLLRENGSEGLHSYFASQQGPASRARELYNTSIIDLEDSDGMGEAIAPQAQKAYQLGLETFMGRLFELHATVVFDEDGTRSMARELAETVSRMCVNKDVWGFIHTELGNAWWTQHGGQVLRHLRHALSTDDTDVYEFGDLYDGLPHHFRSYFARAFNHVSYKYTGYGPLKAFLKQRVEKETEASRSVVPPFGKFFRQYHSYWDETRYPRLRPTHSEAFQAAVRVAGGSTSGVDLCLLTALSCCWDAQPGRGHTSPEAWQPLLHLAQAPGSPVRLTAEELMLTTDASRQVRHDAERICALLGRPSGVEVPNSVPFRCRADYGDAELLATGTVFGRADVLFPGGVLEIKVLKGKLRAEHSAQALWYACALGVDTAWLWDVYRRRLLVWRTPERPLLFLKACLMTHLKYAAPPGHTTRIWPQEVQLASL
jgi:hypothetical protein